MAVLNKLLTHCFCRVLDVLTHVCRSIRTNMFSDGLTLPKVGFEAFCGREVYVGIVLDPENLLRESDETNNVAVSAKIPAASVRGLSCHERAPSQTCKYQSYHTLRP